MGPNAMILVFWMLSFKPTFSLSSFTFIKRFFSSSSLSVIRVVSSAHLKLLIFLLAILNPTCASSSLAFCTFFGIGMKTDLFQSWGHCWVFQICWHVECSTLTASSFRIWNSSAGIPSPPLTLFVLMLPSVNFLNVSHHVKWWAGWSTSWNQDCQEKYQ